MNKPLFDIWTRLYLHEMGALPTSPAIALASRFKPVLINAAGADVKTLRQALMWINDETSNFYSLNIRSRDEEPSIYAVYKFLIAMHNLECTSHRSVMKDFRAFKYKNYHPDGDILISVKDDEKKGTTVKFAASYLDETSVSFFFNKAKQGLLKITISETYSDQWFKFRFRENFLNFVKDCSLEASNGF